MTEFGTVRRDGDGGAVRFERRYATTPEDLWDAWTSPERISRWMGAAVSGTVAAGEKVTLAFGEDVDSQVWLEIESLSPPRLLEWRWTVNGAEPTVLRVELTPVEDGTLLVLDHAMLPFGMTAGMSAGWHNHLEALGTGIGAGEWWPRYVPEYKERVAAL